MAVVNKIVDGAAVDSLIWEYYKRENPELASKTKVLLKSQPYGIPPVVVNKDIDPEMKDKLKEIFLNIHNDERGRNILDGMMIDKFVEIYDSNYEEIRKIKNIIAKEIRD